MCHSIPVNKNPVMSSSGLNFVVWINCEKRQTSVGLDQAFSSGLELKLSLNAREVFMQRWDSEGRCACSCVTVGHGESFRGQLWSCLPKILPAVIIWACSSPSPFPPPGSVKLFHLYVTPFCGQEDCSIRKGQAGSSRETHTEVREEVDFLIGEA